VTTTGAAYCWGKNDFGQLGNGTTTERHVPVAVRGRQTFASVSAGHAYTCGVTTSGVPFCWGANASGALGNGTTIASHVPVAVSGSHRFISVSAGPNFHTCGVTRTGAAWCWGNNGSGELGDGTTIEKLVPVAVSGRHRFAAIGTGFSFTCGVATTGAAYCWGHNVSGQLGNGTTFASLTPVAVVGGHAFASVSPSEENHTCGMTMTGAAYCWGLNRNGEIGDGTTTDSSVPVAVSGNLVFASVSAGPAYACGVTTAGAAYCWGSNDFGQLGDGTTTESHVPVAVISPT
jgi:alpha-tubulin suppressor-like RCC1 family protein